MIYGRNHFLNRDIDSIVGSNNGNGGEPDPIRFTIGVIIYNFNINDFNNGRDGDGKHLIDISRHHKDKWKFGHSLRLTMSNANGYNYTYYGLVAI